MYKRLQRDRLAFGNVALAPMVVVSLRSVSKHSEAKSQACRPHDCCHGVVVFPRLERLSRYVPRARCRKKWESSGGLLDKGQGSPADCSDRVMGTAAQTRRIDDCVVVIR
jgi:hypothetical protein